MAWSSDDEAAAELARELFSPLGAVSIRKMFGGAGLYLRGTIFALIADGIIYLKVRDGAEDAFRAAGSRPFEYESRGKTVRMCYWTLPEEAVDDPELAAAWVGRAGGGTAPPLP
jgi:DNA transformation protein